MRLRKMHERTAGLVAGIGMLAATTLLAGCGGGSGPPSGSAATKGDPVPAEIRLADGLSPDAMRAKVQQLAPVRLELDTTGLDAGQKRVLAKLVEASDDLDRAYLRQVWARNPEVAARLERASGEGMDAARRYFRLMYGPWDRLAGDAPFLNIPSKPPGAGFYPVDLTKEEFESSLSENPKQRESFTSYYTVIRRDSAGLEAVPYSEAFADELGAAADALEDAAAAAENPSLQKFLRMRAAAFRSNEYHDSEVAWVQLEGNRVDPTLGPYEVYEDHLFGYKAAFESFIALKDPAQSRKLAALASHMKEMESKLPIPEEHKNLDRSFAAPISVVDLVYTGGEARQGVQTLAFNLPNDPDVRKNFGSKKVMLRNVVHAKFDAILKPIAERVLVPEQAKAVGFEPYFTRILMHELAHALGPAYVTGHPDRSVSKALQDRYSAIEEAKADATGTHDLGVLTDDGVFTKDFLGQSYVGHVADLFRCIRWGTNEAHGLGCLTQLNFLLEKGAIVYDEKADRFRVDLSKMRPAMSELAGRYLTIEATGDYDGAEAFLKQYGTESEHVRQAVARLADVPVDIAPSYPITEVAANW